MIKLALIVAAIFFIVYLFLSSKHEQTLKDLLAEHTIENEDNEDESLSQYKIKIFLEYKEKIKLIWPKNTYLIYYIYLFCKLLIPFLILMIMLILPNSYALYAILPIVIVYIIPDKFIDNKYKKKMANVDNLIPYVLELTAINIKSGYSLNNSIGMIANDIKPIDYTLSAILSDLYGKLSYLSFDGAIENITSSQAYESKNLNSYFDILSMGMKYGSSISETLLMQAESMRDRRLHYIEERVGNITSKLTIPIMIFIMVPIIIFMVVPIVGSAYEANKGFF